MSLQDVHTPSLSWLFPQQLILRPPRSLLWILGPVKPVRPLSYIYIAHSSLHSACIRKFSGPNCCSVCFALPESPYRQWSLFHCLCHSYFQAWTGLYQAGFCMHFYCRLRNEFLNSDAEVVHTFQVAAMYLSYTNLDSNSSCSGSPQINLFKLWTSN
jgi:hypothetical protein